MMASSNNPLLLTELHLVQPKEKEKRIRLMMALNANPVTI